MLNIVSRDPFDDLLRGFFVRPVEFGQNTTDAPPIRVDVKENNEAYVVHAELPGIKKENIQVNIDGNQLLIAAERKLEKEARDNERTLRTERYYGKVSRSFQLGQDIDEERAVAKFTDGVLELTLPKKATPQARRLSIQ